jgi:hypothetical protein
MLRLSLSLRGTHRHHWQEVGSLRPCSAGERRHHAIQQVSPESQWNKRQDPDRRTQRSPGQRADQTRSLLRNTSTRRISPNTRGPRADDACRATYELGRQDDRSSSDRSMKLPTTGLSAPDDFSYAFVDTLSLVLKFLRAPLRLLNEAFVFD